MPAIDGIVSGLDTTALIDSILGVAAVPQVVMQEQLAEYEERLEAVSGVKGRLEDLATAIEGLDEIDEFASYTATASDEDYVTVTADSDVNPGSYEVEVLALADNEVEVSEGFADKDSTGVVGEGTLNITYGGETTAVTIDSSNSSLELVASEINDNVDGVTAYVMDTGDATDPYRLVIQGDDTGADNTISVDTSGLSGGTVPTFTETSTATDAELSINGISVFSGTDTFTDVVPGLTIEADALTGSAITVDVETDTDGLIEKVQGFVDAYNAVLDYYNTNSVYNPDTDIRGGLVGESGARSVISSLGSLVAEAYSGVSGDYTALSQVGISTSSDGTLELDTEALTDALNDDYDSVEALFTTDDDDTSTYGPLSTIRNTIEDLYVDSDTGTLTSRIDSLESTIEDYEERITDFNEYLSNYEERLRQQFTYMETVLGELQAQQSFLGALLTSSTTSTS